FLAPHEYPRNALVSTATHDLPPLRGFIEGVDIETRKQLGIYQDEGRYHQALQERDQERRSLREVFQAAGFSVGADIVDVISAAYGFLARTPCALLMVQMEDLALEREQANMPGTGDDQHPNWRRKLSRNLDEIFALPSTDAILDAVRRERPRG
ncbi:MAG TPA: 4-alpha-glucanotransferase, partial [Stellaceae bacterium]|nr:4-alpha-glucanotransferase [Stellaceae bacterium]